MDLPPTEYDCRCGRCGGQFTIHSSIGPSEICRQCAWKLLEIIWDTPLRVNGFGVPEPAE